MVIHSVAKWMRASYKLRMRTIGGYKSPIMLFSTQLKHRMLEEEKNDKFKEFTIHSIQEI